MITNYISICICALVGYAVGYLIMYLLDVWRR